GELPAGLEDEIDEHIRRLEERTGKRFGDADDPLLVSVRSGAAISMPGMMDTILNLGLTGQDVQGLATTTRNPGFGSDPYRRPVQMYGEVVDGVEPTRFEGALAELKRKRGVAQDVDLDADDLTGLSRSFERIYEQEVGRPFSDEPRDQLIRAV